MSRTHHLKTWLAPFEAIRTGEKSFEVRRDDRQFATGDRLVLQEWDEGQGAYTGREAVRRVGFILDGGQFGVAAGFVVMSLAADPPETAAGAVTSPTELAQWHALQALNAQQRAANWRIGARVTRGLTADRYLACAAAGDAEAAFHEQAAAIVRGIGS